VLRNVGTHTKFCVFCYVLVGHTKPDPQQGSVFATLDIFGVITATNTSSTIFREEPGRTVTLTG